MLGATKNNAHAKSTQHLVSGNLENKLRGKSEVMDIATRNDYASVKHLKTINQDSVNQQPNATIQEVSHDYGDTMNPEKNEKKVDTIMNEIKAQIDRI